MKTVHQSVLVLALAGFAAPAFAFYQVVEETARVEVAPGNVRTEHFDRIATPIGPVSEEHYHQFNQTLETATNSQLATAYLRQAIPHRRGDRQFLEVGVYTSSTGDDLSNVAQKVRYEVVFDVFSASFLSLGNTEALTFEKIASDNTRQAIALSGQDPTVAPGRYAATFDLTFNPLVYEQVGGNIHYNIGSFYLLQSAVPEPTSWALIGAGLLGVAGMRRLQRRPGRG